MNKTEPDNQSKLIKAVAKSSRARIVETIISKACPTCISLHKSETKTDENLCEDCPFIEIARPIII